MSPKIPIYSDKSAKSGGNHEAEQPEKENENGGCSAPEDKADNEDAQEQQSEAPLDTGNETGKAAEYLDMLKRLKAEFDNYRRRVTKEKAETIRYATESFILKLLPVLDDLQRGIDFARGKELDAEILKGVELVEKQLTELLDEYGVKPYEAANTRFDPNVHEPMYTMERDDVEDNTVVQEERRGYMIHDKILRCARVVVSRKPSVDADSAPGDGGD